MLLKILLLISLIIVTSSEVMRFDKVYIKKIKLEGCNSFKPSTFRELVSDYENKALSYEDLEELRRKASQIYVDKGYINSGFTLNNKIVDGVVTLLSVEGKLGSIKTNLSAIYDLSFLKKRLRKHAGEPFNLKALQRSLQRLRYEPNIKQIKDKFSPGVEPISGVLDLAIKENKAIHWKLFGNNNKPA